MEKSKLETQLKKSKISKIVDEFKQWRQPKNKPYFDHYLSNAVKIIFGNQPIDYKIISHENKMVHSSFYTKRKLIKS